MGDLDLVQGHRLIWDFSTPDYAPVLQSNDSIFYPFNP